MIKADDYLFISGKIRFLETKLPDLTDLERMIFCPDIDSAFKVFYDTDYAQELFERKPEEYEQIILDDLINDRNLLVKYAKNTDLEKLLLLEYDFHNLKVLFKEKLFEKNLDYLLLPLGFYDSNLLKEKIINGQNVVLDRDLENVIEKANKVVNLKLEPFKIENFFDKEYFRFLITLAKRIGNDFIIEHSKLKIDLANLKAFLRLKISQDNLSIFEDIFYEGGNINKNFFLEISQIPLEESFKRISRKFSPRFEKYFSDFLQDRQLWLLEKRISEEEIEFLKKSKFISYGPEILFVYFLAKNIANKNIRLIMAGKHNGIENEIIKERIRKNINY